MYDISHLSLSEHKVWSRLSTYSLPN